MDEQPESTVSELAPRVSVVVTSYRRPGLLARCLEGVSAQIYPGDEVVVVYRHDDEPTRELLARWAALDRERHSIAEAERPGIVPALVAGTEAARGDVVAFLDDDAVPR